MKKIILLITVLLTTLSPVKNANASLFPYSETWFLVTTIPIIGGAVLMSGDDDKKCRVILCLDKFAGLAILVGGFMLLDENNGKVEFSEISKEVSLDAGLTEDEFIAYNNSIEEINLIKDEIQVEMIEKQEKTLEAANFHWQDLEGNLEEDTYSALMKVRLYIGANISIK